MTNTILVIEEESAERSLLCKIMTEKLLYQTVAIEYGSQIESHLTNNRNGRPDIILLDISRMSQPNDKIMRIKSANVTIPIVVLIKYGDYETAVSAINAGAHDFLTKPVAMERMYITFRNAIIFRDLYNGYAKNIMPFSLFDENGNIRRIYELEKEAIRHAMQYYNGRMTEVARRLGIGRSTLYRKLNNDRMSENVA